MCSSDLAAPAAPTPSPTGRGPYLEPTGYWREVGVALERALAVARIDANLRRYIPRAGSGSSFPLPVSGGLLTSSG